MKVTANPIVFISRTQYNSDYYQQHKADILEKKKKQYRQNCINTMEERLKIAEQIKAQQRKDAEAKAQEFGAFLRRQLYLNMVLVANAEWFKSMSFVPPQYKTALQNSINAANRFNSLLMTGSRDAYNQIMSELNEENVLKMLSLFDTCYDIKNLDDVIEVITRSKTVK